MFFKTDFHQFIMFETYDFEFCFCKSEFCQIINLEMIICQYSCLPKCCYLGYQPIVEPQGVLIIKTVNSFLYLKLYCILTSHFKDSCLHLVCLIHSLLSPNFERNKKFDQLVMLLGQMLCNSFRLYHDKFSSLLESQSFAISQLSFKHTLLLPKLLGYYFIYMQL